MKTDLLRQRLAADPHNPLFHFSLAQALSQDAQWQEAVEHLQFCSESRDDWMLPRIMLGKALMESGRHEEALPWLREGLRLAIEQHHDDPAEEARRLLAELGKD
ncbi:molecular chaperone DnaJ [Ruficoccus amylovorans]|uniref:Molecular chaperone DnaJ n=1 Tax=Ruficoccus amylovorans TaxID=1804625 RepID=A0A842HC63_9BACT|nr:molecular chaperone DnaJ [Ruficoccus amylovorans]MBC2594065.1 molecular chaperone DnaJ [Ruficoccus amylovorans]